MQPPAPTPRTSRPTLTPSLQRTYWNGLSDEYQRITRISPDDFHYGPQIPGERELRLLPALRAGMRALELGCGAAQNSLWLARQGLDCDALDISAAQLRHAGALASDAGLPLRLHEGPLEDFPRLVPGTFDLIHSSHAMEFVVRPGDVVRRVFDALVPGGWFVMSTVHPLYNGDWIGTEEDGDESGFAVSDESGREVRGLFLSNYFSPPDDVRYDDAGRPVVISRAYPVSRWFDWLREAGFSVERLAEPPALPASRTPPYTSDAWAEADGELDAIPGTLIVAARKPAPSR